MNIAIQRAAVDDVDRIAPLFDAYRGFYAQPGDLVRGREFIRHRLEREESVIFLAVLDESNSNAITIGFTQLYPVFSSVRMKRKWVLNDLFVAEAHRGLGAGRQLLNRAIEFARETQSRGLELCTGVDNSVAQRLYEQIGLKRIDRFFYYDLPVDE